MNYLRKQWGEDLPVQLIQPEFTFRGNLKRVLFKSLRIDMQHLRHKLWGLHFIHRQVMIKFNPGRSRGYKMKNLRVQVMITRILAVLFLIAGIFSALALTNIAHGEADVSGEWAVVQVTAILGIVFIISTLSSLSRCVALIKNSAL